jgi:hypothetical protein
VKVDGEFEYRPVPGIHHGWRLERTGNVVTEAAESLTEIEDVIDAAMVTYCNDHSVAIVVVHGGHGWRGFTAALGDVVSFCWTLIERDFRCADCGYDIWDETYKVADGLWAAEGNVAGVLCIGCLERRLGQQLTPIRSIIREELRVAGS